MVKPDAIGNPDSDGPTIELFLSLETRVVSNRKEEQGFGVATISIILEYWLSKSQQRRSRLNSAYTSQSASLHENCPLFDFCIVEVTQISSSSNPFCRSGHRLQMTIISLRSFGCVIFRITIDPILPKLKWARYVFILTRHLAESRSKSRYAGWLRLLTACSFIPLFLSSCVCNANLRKRNFDFRKKWLLMNV